MEETEKKNDMMSNNAMPPSPPDLVSVTMLRLGLGKGGKPIPPALLLSTSSSLLSGMVVWAGQAD